MIDHQRRDKNSHIYQHADRTGNKRASIDNFSILNENCGGYRRRKICEALYISNDKRSLNKQEKSVKLSLFN